MWPDDAGRAGRRGQEFDEPTLPEIEGRDASPVAGEVTAMLRAATPGMPRRASEGRLCGPKMHGESGTAVSDGLAEEILPAPGEATAALRTWVQGLPDTDALKHNSKKNKRTQYKTK